MEAHDRQHRAILQGIAHRVMRERGLLPDFSARVLAEVASLGGPAAATGRERDLRELLWCSIDNDDSLDLDQLTVAEALPDGNTKVLVAIADVDSLVPDGTATDGHARYNTTSVYTAAEIFPMLPEQLSTNLTSLNPAEERLAMVVEMVLGPTGELLAADIYPGRVRNHAKLAYDSVAGWLEGEGPMPAPLAAVPGLAENVRLQDQVAQSMQRLRTAHGALTLHTIKAKAIFDGEQLRGLSADSKNRAKTIIEDFMVTANGVTARYLASKGFPSIRRVVRIPKRWGRIVDLAAQHGYTLPGEPDSKALDDFLTKSRAADPLRFPDLSLAIVKLLGSGEYEAEAPGDSGPGHFGLAVKDYAHSTAPNRRYTDLLTQRLLKAAVSGGDCPYGKDDLDELARQCTEQEDAAEKVERQVAKSAAALLLESRIGERFDALVTGASDKGTWVRLLDMPVEGMLAPGRVPGVDVGDRLAVQLASVDVQRGYIDFEMA